MKIPKLLTYAGVYDQYPSGGRGTTYAQLIDYLKNQNEIMAALVEHMWQPSKQITNGQVVVSPNMPAGLYAKAEKSGQTGLSEPSWGYSATYNDNGVRWRMCTLGSVATVDGASPDIYGDVTTPLMGAANASYAGTAGRVPAPQRGQQDYVLTGGLWRALSSIGVSSVNGAKGAVEIKDYVSAVRNSGGTVYFDFKNGTQQSITLTTPKRYVVDCYTNGSNWWEKYNDGWIEQGGRISIQGRYDKKISFLTPFQNTPVVVSGISDGTKGIFNEKVDSITNTGFTAYEDTPGTYMLNYVAYGK